MSETELNYKSIDNIDPATLSPEKRKEMIEQMRAALEPELAKNRIAYWKPWRWQRGAIELFHKIGIMTLFIPAPNKIGKTVLAICIVISWLLGYEPWHEVDKGYPGAVKDGDRHYRPSSLGIKPPVDIVMCGEDWGEHIDETLIPLLKEYMPVGKFKCGRKNQAGIESEWTGENGSTLNFMCYTQDIKIFESSKKHGKWFDEPPPQDKREALARSTFVTRGKEGLSATPIREAWMMDELILRNDPEIGVITGLTILDNEDKYNNEKRALMKMGLTEEHCKKYFNLLIYDDPIKKTCVKDKGRKAEMFVREVAPAELQNFIVELDILRFVKNTSPHMAPARFHGTFSALVGLIYKDYDINEHQVKAMEIKPDWLIVPYIDWHPGTEIALGFVAITEHDMMFVVDEIFINMNPLQVADILINRKEKDKWRIKDVIIDALARGDTGFIRNRQDEGKKPEDSFAIIEKKIKPYKMKLMVGSRDRDSGIVNIQTRLKGPNDIPTLYFYDTLQSYHGGYGHIFEFQRWAREEDGKIMEKYNHFLVGLGWVTLAGIKWRKPVRDYGSQPSTQSSGGTWMGA